MLNRLNNKGFTLIELIVVMAIIAILVLLAAPRFLGYTKDANVTAMLQDTKMLTDASELYHINKNEWPIIGQAITDHGIGGVDEIYSIDESKLESSIKNIKGDYDDYGIVIDGKYVGEVFHLEGVEDKEGKLHFQHIPIKNYESDILPEDDTSDETIDWYLATEDDFEWVETTNNSLAYSIPGKGEGYYIYKGIEPYVEIPHEINGHPMTSYYQMFRQNSVVKGVKSTNTNVTSLIYMFGSIQSEKLNLDELNTSGATHMGGMFSNSRTKVLDLSHFDTSSVISMWDMFYDSHAETIILNSFNTSNVTVMSHMFYGASIKEVDLCSFDTNAVISTDNMFYRSNISTGYARTQADADKFNSSKNKPSHLNFTVKK